MRMFCIYRVKQKSSKSNVYPIYIWRHLNASGFETIERNMDVWNMAKNDLKLFERNTDTLWNMAKHKIKPSTISVSILAEKE